MNIKGKYDVEIKIEKEDEERDIVIIKGNVYSFFKQNQSNIDECAREVEIVYRKYNVKCGCEYQLRGYNNSILYSLINKHYLYDLYIKREWVENQNIPILNVIGSEDSIRSLLREIRNYINL